MEGIEDEDNLNTQCNCYSTSLTKDGKCWYGGNCQQQMIVYNLKCKNTGKNYIGKTQNYLKDRTRAHVNDVWKVIEAERKSKDGNKEGKKGTGSYTKADSFAKHFANECKDCKNGNQVKAKLKEIVEP